MNPVILNAPLNDSDGDGVIKLGTKNKALYGCDTLIFKGVTPEGKFLYWPDKYTPPVAKDPFDILNEKRWWGVNLSGMEFSFEFKLEKSCIDFYAAAGVKSLRIPLKGSKFVDEEKLAWLKDIVEYGTSKGILMVLDDHRYKVMSDPSILEFWLRVGPLFKGNPLVAFDLQNEPEGATLSYWAIAAKSLIKSLRDAGIDNVLIVEWIRWSNAGRMGTAMAALAAVEGPLDPLNRTWFGPHRYFDKGSAGAYGSCTTSTVEFYLGSSTDNARKYGYKVYLGEFAFGRYSGYGSNCKALEPKLIEYLKANSDVWIGGALWGAGKRWKGDYHFRLEDPKNRAATWQTEYGKQVKSLWD